MHRLTGGFLAVCLTSPLVGQDLPIRVADYLMDRDEEIALARSAAPAAVSDSATIWVLEPQGFVIAASGQSEFVCYVARSMSQAPLTPQGKPVRLFIDPAIRAPHCMNAEAARSVGAWHGLMTRLAFAGLGHAAIDSAVTASLTAGTLIPPRSFAVAYMWSPHQHLGPRVGAWKPHMMFYQPYLNQAMVGATEPLGNGPQVLNPATPWAVLIVPVREFAIGESGTAGP